MKTLLKLTLNICFLINKKTTLLKKMLLMNIVVGAVLLSILDYYQTGNLEKLFNQKLQEKLIKQAEEHRTHLDRYIRYNHQAAKIILSQKVFIDYIDKQSWSNNDSFQIKELNEIPPWFPDPSLLRSFMHVRYILLLDRRGKVREMYRDWPASLPDSLYNPSSLLRQLSHEQSFMTKVDGSPFLLTAESLYDSHMNIRATLMIISPIDDYFLQSSQGDEGIFGNIITLISGEDNKIVASSNTDLLPVGTNVDSTKDSYLIMGKSFFDYGASDLLLQLTSFISKEEYRKLNKEILNRERIQRGITAIVLIVFFGFFTLCITISLRELNREVKKVSHHLGIRTIEMENKNELYSLKEQYNNMSDEIIKQRNALEKETEKLRKLYHAVEQSPISIIITDSEGTIEYVNPMFTRLTGFETNEITGRELDAVKSEKSYKTFKDSIASDREWRGEMRSEKKNGDLYQAFIFISPIKDSNNVSTHFLLIEEDITERKLIEEEMIRNYNLLHSVIEGTTDAITLKDKGGFYLLMNHVAADMLGKSADEIVGKNEVDLLPPDTLDQVRTIDERVIAEKETITKEIIHTLKGNELTFLSKRSPFKDSDGNITGIIGISRDITEWKKSEIALKESEKKYRLLSQKFYTLLDAIPDKLVLLTPDLRIQWANKVAAQSLNLSEDGLIGKLCFELWYERTSPCEVCQTLRSFESHRVENDQHIDSGGRIWDVRAFPIYDENGEVRTVMEVASDVTEKIALQAGAMNAGHLASIGELSAGVAHEINNPVNSIINYAQLIKDDIEEVSNVHDYADRILDEGERIANIVRSLLSFARERGGEKSSVNINEALIGVISMAEAKMLKEGILLELNLPSDLTEVIADQQQLQQVFINVINNARYALNEKYPGKNRDKKFIISGEEIILDGAPFVRLTFHDTGTGIAENVKEKVFNPFFSTKPFGKGTGLGLSISHGIIKDHKGNLIVDSKKGEYTAITIEIPKNQ